MTELPAAIRIREAIGSLSEDAHGPRILRFFFDLPIADAWALLPGLASEKTRLAAWHSPADGSFVAGGVAWETQLHGEQRFVEAARCWQDLEVRRLEIGEESGDESLPYCLSGFAFTAPTPSSMDWEGWGDGRLWVPEWLAARVGERVRVVLNAPMTSQEDCTDRLIATMRMLKSLADSPLEEQNDAVMGNEGRSPAMDRPQAERAWTRRVGEARSALQSGEVQKVVLARSEEFEPSGGFFDGIATAFRMREQQEGCTVFMVRRRGQQAFVGATPEELVRVEGRELSTMSLAGTRRRGDGDDEALSEELLNSQKDRYEQSLVTKALTSALLPKVEKLVLDRVPEVAKLADVQHLRTRLTGLLRENVQLFETVDALHPTPAVGGLPREAALNWIAENEDLDRGWYAGPIGWLRPGGDGLFVVAIRSVLLDADKARAFVGCGLVEDSDPVVEWEESEAKLRPAARGLATRPKDGA